MEETPHPFDLVIHILRNKVELDEQVIIFVKRTEMIDRIGYALLKLGYKVVMIHANYSVDVQEKSLQIFMQGRAKILLSAQACTRGIDTQKVKHIITYDLPLQFIDWVHQCGRTARNRTPGTVHTFIDNRNGDDYSIEVINAIAAEMNTKVREKTVDKNSIAPFFLRKMEFVEL